jgi:hypothetical protein
MTTDLSSESRSSASRERLSCNGLLNTDRRRSARGNRRVIAHPSAPERPYGGRQSRQGNGASFAWDARPEDQRRNVGRVVRRRSAMHTQSQGANYASRAAWRSRFVCRYDARSLCGLGRSWPLFCLCRQTNRAKAEPWHITISHDMAPFLEFVANCLSQEQHLPRTTPHRPVRML